MSPPNTDRSPRPLRINPQVRAQATDWMLRFSEGAIDQRERQDFLRWLRASPEHVHAYLRICGFWQQAAQIGAVTGEDDLEALIRLARAEDNIVPLSPTLSPRVAANSLESGAAEETPSPVTRSRRLGPTIAAAASVLLALGGVSLWAHLQRGLYTTDVAEEKTVNLTDGSTVMINSRSRVRVSFTDRERSIELLEGQALFKVAKDSRRPFVVRSAGTAVTALGTQFDVRRESRDLIVTVVEGRVAVSSPEAASRSAASAEDRSDESGSVGLATPPVGKVSLQQLLLGEGEQAIVTPGTASKASHPNILAATAWTEGLLVFDGAHLEEVVREFNRHNAKPILLEDPSLRQLEISGEFPATGNERLIRFLQERFHVTVRETNTEIRILEPVRLQN